MDWKMFGAKILLGVVCMMLGTLWFAIGFAPVSWILNIHGISVGWAIPFGFITGGWMLGNSIAELLED